MSNKVDILNRQPFIDRLIQFVCWMSDMNRECAFAIDGKWGAGKTFVLENFEKQIEVLQSEETVDDKFFYFTITVGNMIIMRNPL